jgi:hypothetical protein
MKIDTLSKRWPSNAQSKQAATDRCPYALAYRGPNIGDDIQTIASLRFMPENTKFVLRENLMEARNRGPIFLLANGWYSLWPNRFIPPRNIKPFYISIHIADSRVLTRSAIRWLKSHQPIGCRDLPTTELLKAAGVDAYFSGCLTLTIQRPEVDRTENVLISDLDPHFLNIVPKKLLFDAEFVTHNTKMGVVPQLGAGYQKNRFERYNQKAQIILQNHAPAFERWREHLPNFFNFYGTTGTDMQVFSQRHEIGMKLLKKFATARLVITSRLHCALPCIAMGTPVIMLHQDAMDPRFIGLNTYLNIKGASSTQNSVDWNPDPVNATPLIEPMVSITEEAVRIQGNPLSVD